MHYKRKIDRRYDSPTHGAYLVHQGNGRKMAVKLTLTDGKRYWATPSGNLYKVIDGVPKGTPAANAMWKLDLNSLKELETNGTQTI